MPAGKRTKSNGSLCYNILSENMNTSGDILLSDDRCGRKVPVILTNNLYLSFHSL
jgi:hypothetical protein